MEMRRLTPVRIARLINQYLEADTNIVVEASNKTEVPAIERIIARMVKDAITGQAGSHTLDFLLQRMIGKVKDVIEYTKENKQIAQMPKTTSMIGSALRLANAELERLESKIVNGESLTPDEAKTIPQLAKAVTDLSEQEQKIKDGLKLNQLSDDDLETQVRQALKSKNPKEMTKQ